jgi:hypothetical protein
MFITGCITNEDGLFSDLHLTLMYGSIRLMIIHTLTSRPVKSTTKTNPRI